MLCPTCGSDRMIPLTFVPPLGTENVDHPKTPVAKCATCGERTYVSVKVHHLVPRD